MSDPKTIGERYSRAIDSSDLRLTSKPSDADLLIAAAWARDQLGPLLFRLHREYETCDQTILVNDKTTEHLLVLLDLPSLRDARALLNAYATQQATKRQFMRKDREVAALVGQCMDIFLRPLCAACNGVGYTGGTHRGDPRIRCRDCRETGHRKTTIGKDEEQNAFGQFLLAEMNRLMARAAGDMKHGAYGNEPADQRAARQAREDIAGRRAVEATGD